VDTSGGTSRAEGLESDGNAEREMKRERLELPVHRVQEVEEDQDGK